MDDIIFPDEGQPLEEDELDFEQRPVMPDATVPVEEHPSGVNPSKYISITFGRFVTLVANHSFMDVVEANENEEVIISTNLLTDLANARRFMPNTRAPLMVIAGIVVGILFGYFIF